MLVELHIQDFAIIDEITLQFSPGFNVITGETGAGKSILIDAVDFALGGRAEVGAIRSEASMAVVALKFKIPTFLRREIQNLLNDSDVDFDGRNLILYRELRTNGRTVARVNGAICKLPVYKELGGLLMDIHGQTEHLSLLKPRNHLYLLDSYASLDERRQEFGEQVRKLNDIRRSIASLQKSEQEREHRIDLLKYQINEIQSARLKDGEEAELREERNRLGNSEKLSLLAEEAYNALYGEDAMGSSGVDALNQAAVALSKLVAIDDTLKDDNDLAQTLAEQVEDLAKNIRNYADSLEVSPRRLEEVEERLEIISRLKRKYGDSIKAILAYAESAAAELDDIELGEERLAALHLEEEKLLRSLGELGKALSVQRREAGERLAAQIVGELSHLRMDGTRFEVSITQEEDPSGCYVDGVQIAFDSTGIDRVEFFMSANPGEPLRPVAKIASGGETARIMLALKTVLSAADRTPTLIFDEIDQGIGGRVGGVVGEKLWGLTTNHQALCVTHLAQIAGFADTHFRVSKNYTGARTLTYISKLNEVSRIQEMAAMLGSTTEAAQQNAEEILRGARRVKQGEMTLVEQPPFM